MGILSSSTADQEPLTNLVSWRLVWMLGHISSLNLTVQLGHFSPSQLTFEKANKSDHLADYLDLTFIIDSGGKLSTRLCDKGDDFDFHIVNLPLLSSNIPSDPSYGVYILQLIRYARCCSHYDDFRYHHKCPVDRLL